MRFVPRNMRSKGFAQPQLYRALSVQTTKYTPLLTLAQTPRHSSLHSSWIQVDPCKQLICFSLAPKIVTNMAGACPSLVPSSMLPLNALDRERAWRCLVPTDGKRVPR